MLHLAAVARPATMEASVMVRWRSEWSIILARGGRLVFRVWEDILATVVVGIFETVKVTEHCQITY